MKFGDVVKIADVGTAVKLKGDHNIYYVYNKDNKWIAHNTDDYSEHDNGYELGGGTGYDQFSNWECKYFPHSERSPMINALIVNNIESALSEIIDNAVLGLLTGADVADKIVTAIEKADKGESWT